MLFAVRWLQKNDARQVYAYHIVVMTDLKLRGAGSPDFSSLAMHGSVNMLHGFGIGECDFSKMAGMLGEDVTFRQAAQRPGVFTTLGLGISPDCPFGWFFHRIVLLPLAGQSIMAKAVTHFVGEGQVGEAWPRYGQGVPPCCSLIQ